MSLYRDKDITTPPPQNNKPLCKACSATYTYDMSSGSTLPLHCQSPPTLDIIGNHLNYSEFLYHSVDPQRS